MPPASLFWVVAAVIGLSAATHSDDGGTERAYAAGAPLQHPINIPSQPMLAADVCSGGTRVETSTDTVVITVTPSPQTTTIVVTATAPTATDTYTETTTELPDVTQTTAITCFASPGVFTTGPVVCVTTTTTQTVTSSITLSATTATSTDTTTVTPSTSVTTTDTSTVSVSTATTITTTPSPATSVVGSVSPTGLKYYDYYPRTYKVGSDYFANVPAIVNGLKDNDAYNISGSVRNLNSLASSGAPVNFPDGQSGPGSLFACLFQGYLYPALGAGTYKIRSRDRTIDDVGLVWTGDKAVGSNWSYGNVDYGAEWPTTGAQFPSSGSVSLPLDANQAKALTIFWGNADGPGSADFVVEFAGTTYTNTSQFFVGPCDGSVFRP